MIEVQGTPVGKGRPRFTRDGHAFTPDGTRDFEARIKWKAKVGSKEVHDGAVIVLLRPAEVMASEEGEACPRGACQHDGET